MGPGIVVCDPPASYSPRDPEENVLYGVVAAQLETFLARQRRRERPVPRFVERELRSFLECGVLAHGFLRVHCDNNKIGISIRGAFRQQAKFPGKRGRWV